MAYSKPGGAAGLLVAVKGAQQVFVFLHEGLGGVEEFFEVDGDHLEVVERGVLDIFHFKMAADPKTFHDGLEFVGPVESVLKGFQFCRGGGTRKMPVGGLAEVFLGKVNQGYPEKGGHFEQVANLGLCSTVFVGGDIAAVQANAGAQLLLAPAEALAEDADVAVQVNLPEIIRRFVHKRTAWLIFLPLYTFHDNRQKPKKDAFFENFLPPPHNGLGSDNRLFE